MSASALWVICPSTLIVGIAALIIYSLRTAIAYDDENDESQDNG